MWGHNYQISQFSQLLNASSSRDRGHNGNGVALPHRGVLLLQVADIFVVEVHVDKGTQLTVLGIKMAAQLGMCRGELPEGIPHGAGLHLDGIFLIRILAERSRNQDFHRLSSLFRCGAKPGDSSLFGECRCADRQSPLSQFILRPNRTVRTLFPPAPAGSSHPQSVCPPLPSRSAGTNWSAPPCPVPRW